MKSNMVACRRIVIVICLALLGSFAGTTTVFGQTEHAQAHRAPARLVQLVRDATLQYQDVNVAVASGYGPFLGCVSGPDHGAMGFHYVSLALYADGEIDATKPEALMYEQSNGRLLLVGAEFIVDAQTWLSNHQAPPVLEGQTFNLVEALTGSICRHSSSFMCGPGRTTLTAHSSTGTTTLVAMGSSPSTARSNATQMHFRGKR